MRRTAPSPPYQQRTTQKDNPAQQLIKQEFAAKEKGKEVSKKAAPKPAAKPAKKAAA
jgi:hypothetical protein